MGAVKTAGRGKEVEASASDQNQSKNQRKKDKTTAFHEHFSLVDVCYTMYTPPEVERTLTVGRDAMS